jgi:hypothetical protein
MDEMLADIGDCSPPDRNCSACMKSSTEVVLLVCCVLNNYLSVSSTVSVPKFAVTEVLGWKWQTADVALNSKLAGLVH